MTSGNVATTLVRLRIVDSEGRTVHDGTLSVVRSTVPFPEVALLPDERGLVELRLPPGSFTFRAHGPAGRSGEATVDSPGAADTVVDIKIT